MRMLRRSSNFAELHAHTAMLSKVSQRFFDFYIAAAQQWLTCLEGATSKTGYGGYGGVSGLPKLPSMRMGPQDGRKETQLVRKPCEL